SGQKAGTLSSFFRRFCGKLEQFISPSKRKSGTGDHYTAFLVIDPFLQRMTNTAVPPLFYFSAAAAVSPDGSS
ncbi:MAG TPA: hypothetical protein VHL11_17165, partial [Phototrophicaceae bacterium]|nr:hypothetical protein [Phototrophicaceae bacterium]